MAMKQPAKWVHFALSYRLLSPWQPPGQYGAISRQMAAFIGLYYSPGPPPLGDARSIAPPWLSKYPVMEVHLFAAATYFDCCSYS